MKLSKYEIRNIEAIDKIQAAINKASESGNNSPFAVNVISNARGFLANFTNPPRGFNPNSITDNEIRRVLFDLNSVIAGARV